MTYKRTSTSPIRRRLLPAAKKNLKKFTLDYSIITIFNGRGIKYANGYTKSHPKASLPGVVQVTNVEVSVALVCCRRFIDFNGVTSFN